MRYVLLLARLVDIHEAVNIRTIPEHGALCWSRRDEIRCRASSIRWKRHSRTTPKENHCERDGNCLRWLGSFKKRRLVWTIPSRREYA